MLDFEINDLSLYYRILQISVFLFSEKESRKSLVKIATFLRQQTFQ